MIANSLTQIVEPVNFTLAGGIYPYDDPEDQYVVIVDGEEVAWASTWSQAQRSYNELLHYDGEHRQKCPGDYIPFLGEPVPYESDDTGDTGLEAPL